MPTYKGNLALWGWIPFFFVPFFVPELIAAQTSRDLAVLACALWASGWSYIKSPLFGQQQTTTNHTHWIVLGLLFTSIAINLVLYDTDNPWVTWRQGFYLAGVVMVYAMLRRLSPEWFSSRGWAALLLGVATAYLIYALIAPFQAPSQTVGNTWLHWWSERTAHFPGPLRQQNLQALFMAICTLLVWRQMLICTAHNRWTIASLIPICGVLLTASRSGVIVLLLAATLLWWAERWRMKSLGLMIGTLFAGWLLSQLLFTLYPAPLGGSVVAHIGQQTSQELPSIRMFIWRIAMHTWLLHPWLGGGGGMLPAHWIDNGIAVIKDHPQYAPIAQEALASGNIYAHNILLQYLVEFGIVGASGLLLIMITLARSAWKWGRNPPTQDPRMTGWMVAVLLLVHGMVSVAIMQMFFMVILAASLAACFAAPPQHSQEECPNKSTLQLFFLLPSMLFATCWLHLVFEARQLEGLTQHNIHQSPALQRSLYHAIHDPWLEIPSMERYFMHLVNDGATQQTWSNSEDIALLFWSKFQYANGMKFLMIVYHAQNNRAKELAWAKRYAVAFSHDPYRLQLLEHARHGHPNGHPFPL